MPIKTLPASILLSLLCAAPALQAWQATPESTAADKACAEAKALIEAKRDLPKAIALLRTAAEQGHAGAKARIEQLKGPDETH